MRRRQRIYHKLRRGIALSLFLIIFATFSFSMTALADGTDIDCSHIYQLNRYEELTTSSPTSPGTDPDAPSNNVDPVKEKDEIDRDQFNNAFIDTAIYILGGLAGMMMLLQIAAFCMTRVYPSTNKFFEKLKVIGIDGYDRGYVVPTVKILLLGVLSFFCVSGLLKQAVAYILGWFVVIFN